MFKWILIRPESFVINGPFHREYILHRYMYVHVVSIEDNNKCQKRWTESNSKVKKYVLRFMENNMIQTEFKGKVDFESD